MLDSLRPQPAFAHDTVPTTHPVVVIAEDDDLLRRALSDLLADEGFLVREVRDRVSLESELMNAEACAAVIDVHLADGHCGHLVEALAADAEAPHVVLMSAFSDAAGLAEEHGLELLRKPFDLRELLDAVLVAVRAPTIDAFPRSVRFTPSTSDRIPDAPALLPLLFAPDDAGCATRFFRVALSRTPRDANVAARRACAPPEVCVRDDGSAFARYGGQSLLRFQSLDELLRRFAIDEDELVELVD